MAVHPKPRPVQDRAVPPERKHAPLLLAAGLGAAVVIAGIGIAFVTLRKPPPPQPARKTAAAVEPEFSVKIHQRDLGRERKITILAKANVRFKPEDLSLEDGAGKEYPATPADARDCFLRDVQREPGAKAVSFRAPAGAETLDLRLPGGKTVPVYRRPGPEAERPFSSPVRFEDWTLVAQGMLTPGLDFDLEIRARPAVDTPLPLDPKEFLLLTDGGQVLAPQVRTEGDPLRLRYPGIHKSARRLLLQTGFRGERPEYWVHPVAPAEEAPPVKPDPAAPKVEAPPPAPAGLRAAFEARLSDPVAALRFLAAPPSDEAKRLAREALARLIPEDAAAGMKAFAEGKADLAEKSLARAALLADPYSPDLSRQLMRALFLMKQPRKVPTECTTCSGAGAAPCGACRKGLSEGACPRCEAKGQVACLLCEGSGTMDHHGYKGSLVLIVEKDIRIKHQSRMGTLKAQTLTYQTGPCTDGQFPLRTESVVTADGTRKTDSVQQPCTKFWDEMKLFVFSGKAKIKVLNPRGQLVPFPPIAAKRFFTDYEHCKGGRVTCDRCTGKKTDPCAFCAGKGKAMLLCAGCEGTSLKACAACKGYGDTAWLAGLLPPASAPELSQALAQNAAALRGWLDERARLASRREDLARRFEEAEKGLDPTAKLTADTLEVACPRCKGQGGDCEECWATGRREYYDGTPQYERYALVERLKRQIEDKGERPADPPSFGIIAAAEAATTAGPVKPPPVLPPVSDPARKPAASLPVPPAVQDLIRKADALHETGRANLQKAKTSTDPAIWMDAAAKALADIKQAQTLYATAQEKLDDLGIEVPKELLQKFRINMQALVMARRAAP
jgi:hypothetical protein